MSGLRDRLAVEGLDAAAWSSGAYEAYAAHDHGYDKVLVCERGSIRFGLPGSGDAADLGEGDRLELPAGTTHDARVGPAGVTCLETHLPAGSLARLERRASGSW